MPVFYFNVVCILFAFAVCCSVVKAQPMVIGVKMDKFVMRLSNCPASPGENKKEPEEKEKQVELTTSGSKTEASISAPNADTTEPLKKKRRHHVPIYQEYLTLYKWLKIDEAGNKICVLCNTKIEGGRSHIQRHEKVQRHIKKTLAVANTENVSYIIKETARLDKHEANVRRAEYKLNMGLLVEHNCAIRIMDHVPNLMKSCFPDSKIAASLKCKRTKSTQMLHTMECEATTIISKHLRNNNFSLIVDETTDISVKKCLAIVARYFKEYRVVKDELFVLKELQNFRAEDIVNSIKLVLEKHKIPLRNLIGFGADNASVMMGNLGGVQSKLKELNPNIFVLGCVCHSLHLCASASAKMLPSWVEEFVRDVYNYLAGSSKRLQAYQQFQEFLDLKPHKILKLSQTRWLSLEAVVSRILQQYNALQLYFVAEAAEDKQFERPMKIVEKFYDYDTELYLSFLANILPVINKINQQFQSEKPQLHLFYDSIMSLYKTILKNFMKSQFVDKKDRVVDVNPLLTHEYLPDNEIYLGEKTHALIIKYKLTSGTLIKFYNHCLKYYVELSIQMRTRFQNLETYKHFKLLNPKNVLEKPGHITSLLNEFSHLVPETSLELIASEYREICNISKDEKDKLVE